MNISLINPYIRVAMDSRISFGNHISRRIIYDYEIIYLESGEFTLIYDDVTHHCRAGDIIFIHPGIAHSFLIDSGDISQPHIHFDITHRPQSEKIPVCFKDIDQLTDTELGWIHKDYFSEYSHSPLLTVQSKSEFLKCFYQIVRQSDHALVKKSLMIRLISIIINDNFRENVENQADFCVEQQIKDYIDAGNGLGMMLDNFADTFFYSKFYLEKKFKEAFGVGIIEYRNKKRMDYANDLLRTHSVSKVAELLGYQSIYSFSRAYKLHFGHAPSKR